MRRVRWLLACFTVLLTVALGTDVAGAGNLPTVTRLEPSSGSTSGGTQLTIFGDFLENLRSVHFGMTAGKNLEEECNGECEISPYTLLTVESPPHRAGTVNVTVTTAEGTSAKTAADEFTYLSEAAPPSIEGLSAAHVTETGARLKAQINPNGAATHFSFWVKYDPCQHGAGECPKGPQTEQVGEGNLPAGVRPQVVREQLGSLRHGCLYAYWVDAANSQGEAESSHQTVETTGKAGLDCLR